MKVLKTFENTYLYDTEVNGEKIIRRKMKLCQEQIQDGATLPTHLIQYENGGYAICDPDMYFHSQEAADAALEEDLRAAVTDNWNEVDRLWKVNTTYSLLISELEEGK